MNKLEQFILKEKLNTEYNQLHSQYIEIMQRLFPEYLKTPYERFLYNHKEYNNDGNFLDIVWDIQKDEYEKENYNHPTHIMNLFYDYVYNDKTGLNVDEKEFIKKFEKIINAKCRLNNQDNDLEDTKILHFDNKDIVITDPCYVFEKDWHEDCSNKLNNYIYHSTLIGDVTTTIYKIDNNIDINKDFLKIFAQPQLGTCTADAGLIGVFDLNEVLQYDPNFSTKYLSKAWCVARINNFTGTVQIKIAFDFINYEFFYYVEGLGNINFIGVMTSI